MPLCWHLGSTTLLCLWAEAAVCCSYPWRTVPGHKTWLSDSAFFSGKNKGRANALRWLASAAATFTVRCMLCAFSCRHAPLFITYMLALAPVAKRRRCVAPYIWLTAYDVARRRFCTFGAG